MENAMKATALVISADIRDDQLIPMAIGSGAIVHSNGSILVNTHQLFKSNGKPYDVFLVGQFVGAAREPLLRCAGRAIDSKAMNGLDLSLVRCEFDLDGAPFEPRDWSRFSMTQDEPVIGENLQVLGYPNIGGNRMRVTEGVVTKTPNGVGTYLETNASITHGNSGGAAINTKGELVGIPSAFQLATHTSSSAVKKSSLIIPVQQALPFLGKYRASPGARPNTEPRTNSMP